MKSFIEYITEQKFNSLPDVDVKKYFDCLHSLQKISEDGNFKIYDDLVNMKVDKSYFKKYDDCLAYIKSIEKKIDQDVYIKNQIKSVEKKYDDMKKKTLESQKEIENIYNAVSVGEQEATAIKKLANMTKKFNKFFSPTTEDELRNELKKENTLVFSGKFDFNVQFDANGKVKKKYFS